MPNSLFPPAPTDPPAALVEHGHYRLGTYNGAIPVINPLDAAPPGRLNRSRRAARNLRLKEWEAFQLGDDRQFVLGAVYNAKTVGLLQVLVVDKEAGTIGRWEKKVAPTTLRVAHGLLDSSSKGRTGEFRVEITNELARDRISVDASTPATGDRPSLGLHVVGDASAKHTAHLVVVHPFGEARALYSHKAIMPAKGPLVVGGDELGLAADRGFLIVDDHHGDYPRPMRYDWVTAARRNRIGQVEGFNLTDNQIQRPEYYNENAIWIANRLHRLPPVSVERPRGPWGPWYIRDREGAVDVNFRPTVRSTMHVGPRKSLAEYYAPYGWFEGTLWAEHATLKVDGFFGVGEQKRISV